MTISAHYDVIIIGFGAAGAVAALTAHDAGAKVLLIEKMPYPGGLSVASAGGVRITFERDAGYRYLRATCGQRTPDEVLQALAQGMLDAPTWLRQWAAETEAEIRVTPALGNYPFDGFDSLGYAEVTRVRSSWSSTAPLYSEIGSNLFAMLYQCVQQRDITVWLETPALQLLRNTNGVVDAVQVRRHGDAVTVFASTGVILTTGGFEASAELQSDYFEAGPALPASFLGNTGDGIRMSMALGARQWHMWHYHGPYGYKHPDPAFRYGLYVKNLPMWTPGHWSQPLPVMPWILLDQTGQRFVNEYEPYPGDTGVRHFAHFDAQLYRHTRLPAYLLVDSVGFARYPLGRVVANDPLISFRWSPDNQQELALGLFQRYESLNDIAVQLDIAQDTLLEQIERWNRAVALGQDVQFGRRPETMVAIATGPFYLAQVWPLVINTQGGPAHDAHQRVLDVSGQPIAHLYAAGELGSVFGHVYMAGGNLAECLVGGRTAALDAIACARAQDARRCHCSCRR